MQIIALLGSQITGVESLHPFAFICFAQSLGRNAKRIIRFEIEEKLLM